MYQIIVKTEVGLERLAATKIKEILPQCEVIAAPSGFKGLVVLRGCDDVSDAYNKIKQVAEASRIEVMRKCVKARLEEILNAIGELASEVRGKRFAVRTFRRGRHSFTSVDVNTLGGAEILRKVPAKVDLTNPEKVIVVEIIGDIACLSVLDPKEVELKKMKGKIDVRGIIRKISIAQEPYLGPIESIRELGRRIGRIVQSYEIPEYIVAPYEPVRAYEIAQLVLAIDEGIRSRLEVERKAYHKEVRKTNVMLYDMYQLVYMRSNEPIIVFEPEGEPISKVVDELKKLFKKKRVNLLLGARKGVPLGIYRYADLVVDIAPGITLSTEVALAASIEAVIEAVYQSGPTSS